jgi:hypothetical protein
VSAGSNLVAMAADDRFLIVAIVLSRLALPLLIPRFPLVILAALVLDAVDGSLLAHFTSVDVGPNGPYQSFDKALDIYYLAIAYLATMRNWRSTPAFRIARFLFYYRLVGVVAFELLDSRAMLLIFPNTFEFYFIAYEGLRLRWDPERWPGRLWSGGSTSRSSTSPTPCLTIRGSACCASPASVCSRGCSGSSCGHGCRSRCRGGASPRPRCPRRRAARSGAALPRRRSCSRCCS